MDEKKLFVIRCIAILLLIFGLSVFKVNNISYYTVILLLLFIINSQTRFFILKDKSLLVFVSLCLEWIIAYVTYKNYGGIVFFYFFIAALDSAFLIKGFLSYLSCGLAVFMMVLAAINLGISEILTSASALIILCILADYIKEEKSRKLEAQKLYDKLRVTDEKLKKANEDLKSYANSIEELTLLRERNRISREIHDSVGHSLATMIIQLGAIEKVAEGNGAAAVAMAKNLGDFAKNSLQEVRAAVRALKPREFEEYEGILAIEELTKNFQKLTGVEVRLSFTKEKWQLNSDQSFVIYRVVQEFLSNAVRHGKATKVNVFMNFAKGSLIITMQDNGIGADDIVKGVGLKSISERVKELKGDVSYSSKKGEGFFLKVVLYAETPAEILERG